MTALEELKKEWETQPQGSEIEEYDLASLKQTVKGRVQKHKKLAIQYFRTHLFLQLLVYLLLGYVIVAYWTDTMIITVSVVGFILYIPFTIFLYKRAREVVSGNLKGGSADSLYSFIEQSHYSLHHFYRFKKLIDVILTPPSCVIGTYLTFELLIPGGIQGNIYLTMTMFVITLISCYASIRDENRKKFEEPLQQLKELMDELLEIRSTET